MDGKINFITLLKNIASYLKDSLKKAFAPNHHNNYISLHNHKVRILNKITTSHTKVINDCFVRILVALCIAIIIITYYEQNYKFKRLIETKTELAHSHIENTIKSYERSLNSIGQAILKDKKYLDSNKVIQLLRLTYIADENIRLLPITWNTLLEPYKSFTTRGSITNNPDKQLLEKFNNNNANQFFIYNKFDKRNEPLFIIYSAVIEQNQNNDLVSEKKQKLVGYFTISVKVSTILQSLYGNFSDDELLKIFLQDQAVYFNKQKNIFQLLQPPLPKEYQFANEMSFSSYPFKIMVGKLSKHILYNSLKVAGIRCGLALIVGAIMLLIYNLIERKRSLTLYKDNEIFIRENHALEQQVQDLTERLERSNKENETLVKQALSYKISSKTIIDIEDQIHNDCSKAIGKMRDYNNLLVKHCTKEKEIGNNEIEDICFNFHKVSIDLLNNVVSRNNDPIDVNIETIIDEVIAIYSPIITANHIEIKKNISKKIKIHTNELILKQVLISLFARSVLLLPSESTINIPIRKNIIQNNLSIEINNNGFGFNEERFNRIFIEGKSDLPSGIINIQLEPAVMERLIKETLTGDLKIITKHNRGYYITLSLPFKLEKYYSSDKIIPYHKVAALRMKQNMEEA